MEKLISTVVKLTVLISGIVLAMEAMDLFRRREESRYLISEDFTD